LTNLLKSKTTQNHEKESDSSQMICGLENNLNA
jgi:hypothetical protein